MNQLIIYEYWVWYRQFVKDRKFFHYLQYYRICWTIRRTMIFSLDILEKNDDECILILVIYWKKTGLVHTKISNHNIIYSS